MLSVAFVVLLSIALAATLVAVGFGLAKRQPSIFTLSALALVEVSLLIQLVIAIVLAASGGHNSQNLAEFFIYLVVAMLVPVLAIFWSLVERVFWSNYVLAVGAFTVFVMVARMHILWPAS